jgi:hypothetical protein
MPNWCAWRRAGTAGHHWLRIYYARLGHLSPYLPEQPGYHKRLKAAALLLATVIDHLAAPGSTARPVAATRPARGGAATTSTDHRDGAARTVRMR